MMFILERLLAEKHGDSAFHSGVCLPVLVTPPPVVDTDFYPFTTTDRIETYGKSSKSWQRAIIVPSLMYIRHFWTLRKHKASEAYDALFQFDGVH